VTTLAGEYLASDSAVPLRDTLLDPTTAPVPIDATAVEVMRCKYRVGESLRVLYRCATSAGDRFVTVRASAGRAIRWWTFPDDRRLPDIDALLAPSAALVAMAGRRGWVRSEVVEYAPERSITVRAVNADGNATAYVKQYAAGERDVDALAARYDQVARALGGSGVPRPLGWSSRRGVLALEAAPGTRWADLTPGAAPTSALMGRAIAAFHGVPAPAGTPPFERLAPRRVERSAEVLAAARPDLAPAARDLARRLAITRRDGPPVMVHGDCHPKNAIVDGDRMTLIDLDQAGRGTAAADIGSLLARGRVVGIVGGEDAAAVGQFADAFLAGYASQRALPDPAAIRWHTAAALVVEQAVRAVNRVRPDVLARLGEVLGAAADLLPAGSP
jgi:aminoglycoside phosphotransferase